MPAVCSTSDFVVLKVNFLDLPFNNHTQSALVVLLPINAAVLDLIEALQYHAVLSTVGWPP